MSTGLFPLDDDVTRGQHTEFPVSGSERPIGDRQITRTEDVVGDAVGVHRFVQQPQGEFDRDTESGVGEYFRIYLIVSL